MRYAYVLIAILISQFSLSQQTGEIFGLEFRTGELRLAKVNPVNGGLNVVSSSPSSADQFGSGISDLDPVNKKYFYQPWI